MMKNLDDIFKEILTKKTLMVSFLKGIMAGEGTVYSSRIQTYVKIEMRNEKIMKFVCEIFTRLSFKCKLYERHTRKSMFYFLINKSEVHKYYKMVGFGCNNNRQEKLKRIVEAM